MQIMEKPILIAGIDPGTTTAYALLDLKGNVVKIGSGKELGLNELIKIVIEEGTPIVASSDKKRIPSFVESFAAKVGARVINPPADLGCDEKRDMAKGMSYANDHQMDALSSAVFALKKLKSLLKKIDEFVVQHKKEKISAKLKELVIKEGINIRLAADIIEKPEDSDVKLVKKAMEDRQPAREDFYKLYEKLKNAEKEAFLLKKHSAKLENELKMLNQKDSCLKKRIEQQAADKKDRSTEDLLRFKEKKIVFLERAVLEKDRSINLLKAEINSHYKILSKLNDMIVVKKLRNLGWNEFEYKNRLLSIKKGDVLLVSNVNEFSDKAVSFLKGKVDLIISEGELTDGIKAKLPFTIIKAKELKLRHDRHFAFIDKAELERIKEKSGMLQKIVEEYQEERSRIK